MAKRFTDSEKWSKPWFRKLPPAMKLFWMFLTDRCDLAGLIDVDFDLAEFCIGAKIDPAKARECLDKQIHVLPDGKWFILDFIEFQYKELREDCKLHKVVMDILNRYGVYDLWLNHFKGIDTVPIQYGESIETLQDKDRDKVLDKELDKDKDTETINQVISHLNEVTNQHYRLNVPKTRDIIRARIREGFKVDDFFDVIEKMNKVWGTPTPGEKNMAIYLRPETLFGTKFESYLNRKKPAERRNPWIDDLEDTNVSTESA